MARNLPDRFVLPLSLLGTLPQAAFDRALHDLSNDTFLANPKALALLLEQHHTELSRTDARELSQFLQAMAGLSIGQGNRPLDEVLDEMVLAKNLDLTEAQRADAKARALRIVASEAVTTLAFIQQTYSHHEKPVSETAVAVDVRPAFDGDNQLLAMTSWQTLLVSYDEGTETKTLEFAVDRDDLKLLKEQVESALAQLDAVETALQEAGLRLWTPTVDNELAAS